MFQRIAVIALVLAAIGITAYVVGCAGKPETDAERLARWTAGNFTSFELQNGIGPIKEKLEVGPVNASRAARGEELFTQKCATCHQLDGKKTGPALREITKRRSPEYVLNQILNPDQMGKLHPDGKQMVAQYMQYMTIQGITMDDARALLDFLRSEADKASQAAK